MKPHEWTFKKPATLAAIRELRSHVNAVLSRHNVAVQENQHWLLAVSELGTNIVKHATPAASYILLTLCLTPEGWSLHFEDDGGATQAHTEPSALPDELSESGYGIAVIRTLFARVDYQHTADGLNLLVVAAPFCAQKKPVIVVVDDDPVIRRLILSYLEHEYTCVPFSAAENAIPYILGNQVDLILSDIAMQGMDGLSLRKNLSGQLETDILPFVFITGDDSGHVRQTAARLGVDDYLVKPVKKAALLDIVSRVLQRSLHLKNRISQRLDPKVTAGLRPSLPSQIGSYRLAVESRVASAGGGDYLLHNHSLLLLGDIMGHGEQAKFFAYAHAGYFRGLICGLYKNEGVDILLNSLSQSMLNDSLLSGALTTCIAAELGEQSVSLACAGHPRPWLIQPDKVEILPITGMLAGIAEDTRYSKLELTLAAGERLMLYTDGLLESRSQTRAQLYHHELEQLLLATLSQPIEQAARAIAQWFDHLHGGTPEDDMTVVLIEHVSTA